MKLHDLRQFSKMYRLLQQLWKLALLSLKMSLPWLKKRSTAALEGTGMLYLTKSLDRTGPPMKTSTKSILEGPASQFPTIFTAFVLLLKTGWHNRTIQKLELKTKKQDRTIKEWELKTKRHNRPIQKSELKTKKQDQTIKESELKTNRHNRPIQKSELGINRLYRPIQLEDRIGIGRSINRTFRPPLLRSSKFNWAPCAQLYTTNDNMHTLHSVSLIYRSFMRALLVSPNTIDNIFCDPCHWLGTHL